MKLKQALFLIFTLFFVFNLLKLSLYLLRLFTYDWDPYVFQPTVNDYITSINGDADARTIPKIIHQTFKRANLNVSMQSAAFIPDIPDNWHAARDSCIRFNSDYEYMFWTDESAENFIQQEYPQYLDNYNSYPYGIQRADALRYFILHKYGGVYLDLDIGCRQSLNNLLDLYDDQLHIALLPKTAPIGVSNDLMISSPQHPFMKHLIDNLHKSNHYYGTKFPTVMFSTGPAYVDGQLMDYLDAYNKDVLLLNEYQYTKQYFYHTLGSSWHGSDARFFHWYHENTVQAILVTITVVIFILYGLSRIFRISLLRCFTTRNHSKKSRRTLPV